MSPSLLSEYDNDDPYATERKFAKESAIMSSVRSEQTRPRKTSQTPAKPVRRDWTQERELEKKEQEDEDERVGTIVSCLSSAFETC